MAQPIRQRRVADRIRAEISGLLAREMAAGARRRAGASVAVATTGVAGPDGGSPEKPVGTVCFALSAEDQEVSRRHQLWGTRDWVKLLASQLALDWVRRRVLGLPITADLFPRLASSPGPRE